VGCRMSFCFVKKLSTAVQLHFQHFTKREDGTFTVFGLFVFCAMLLVAGLAVDSIRTETLRIKMQGVTDRAVLAATMMGENNGVATPEELLESYFVAAGLRDQLADRFSITDSPWTGRNVHAVPSATLPTLFSQFYGVNDFTIATPAAAAEAVTSVWLDIVLVLDISGSMGFDGGNRMTLLRQAASQFAQTLLTDNRNGRVSLTIVPYDTAVLPPPAMLPFFNNLAAGSGACPDFNTWNTITNSVNSSMFRRMCHTDAWGQITPFISEPGPAIAAINALQPRDVTSIDLGARWGAVFFDPTIRPAIQSMIGSGAISSDFSGRPFDWTEPNVVRAMVLMTDGENCCGHRFGQPAQDQNTRDVCAALRAQNVLIYTVAFEAPPEGQSLMMNCASSPSHYFDSEVGGLMNIFAAIATNVVTQTLRLTQ
jgi:hypothetical protein